jgi:hypothetical protein
MFIRTFSVETRTSEQGIGRTALATQTPAGLTAGAGRAPHTRQPEEGFAANSTNERAMMSKKRRGRQGIKAVNREPETVIREDRF